MPAAEHSAKVMKELVESAQRKVGLPPYTCMYHAVLCPVLYILCYTLCCAACLRCAILCDLCSAPGVIVTCHLAHALYLCYAVPYESQLLHACEALMMKLMESAQCKRHYQV